MARVGRVDPYLDFRYAVEVDSVVRAGFSEVSGLEMEVETETYEEGGVNDRVHVLPTRGSTGNVTLRRGLTDAEELWSWAKDAVDGYAERRTVRVIVHDRRGAEAISWQLLGALPVRWSGPDLSADGGQVAVEAFELAYEQLTRHGGNR